MSNSVKTSVLLPKLPFGEVSASLESDIDIFRERMATVVTSVNQYEAVGDPKSFRNKSLPLNINGLKLVASANTPVQVSVGDTRDVTLMIPFHGQCISTVDRITHRWRAGESAMFLPALGRGGGSTTRATLTTDIDPHRLEAVALGMLGQPAASKIDLRLDEDKVLPLHARGISFDDGFRHLCGLIDSHLHQPQSLALLGIDDLFYRNIALMMRPELFLIQDHAEKRTDWKTIDGLCEYIEANLDKRLTLTDFEQVSGLSARGLQFAFQRRFQCTPMEWVRWERLVLARKRLSNAIPGTTVMAVALACGFSNPGKFARHYQKRFGELPSDTLARSFAA